MLKDIRKFYEKTKFDFSKKEVIKNFQWPLNWIKIFFKTYPRFPKIRFKSLKVKGELYSLLSKRISIRDFKEEPVSLQDLEKVLYFSVGIKGSNKDINKTRRFYPSAGARYPIETYLISNNIEGVDKGLYHYNVKSNELERLLKKDLTKESKRIFGEEASKDNPNFIISTGVMSRNEVKYGINAYRFALLEAGHIGQNISLVSEKIGLGSCAIGGFDNDELVRLLDLGEDEIPLYVFSFGKPKEQNLQ